MSAATLEFQGEEHFAVPPERVFAVLTDLDRLQHSIPDLVSAERVDERTLSCVVRPGFSFLRGTLKLTIHLADFVPPKSATMRIDSRGIGQTVGVESRIAIEPEGAGSKVDWRARVVELKGLVATISPALVCGAADQVVRTAWRECMPNSTGSGAAAALACYENAAKSLPNSAVAILSCMISSVPS